MAKSNRYHTPSATPRELPTWLTAVALAATIWLIYRSSLSAPWIFDDSLSVLSNPTIVALWPLVGDTGAPGPLQPPIENPMSARPLVNLSFAANYHFGKFDPRGYRAVNIALHFCNALLVYSIVCRTLRLPHFDALPAHAAPWLATFAALLWAGHPLLTEAVVYVTQRTELMVAFCYLATLYASLRYWTANSTGARRWWLAAAAVACLAGAGSKEVIVSAPLVVWLFDWTFVSRTARELWQKHWPLYAELATSWIALLVLQIGSPRGKSAGFELGVPLASWWCTQAEIFFLYLRLALWPAPLAIHYEWPQLETLGTAWIAVFAVLTLAMAALWLVLRRRAAGWPLATVLAILAPTHLVPITTEIAAERRMYLPLAVIMAVVVIGGFETIGRLFPARDSNKSLTALATLAAFVTVVYGITSAERVATFREPVALWRQNVELQPYNHVAQLSLASALSAAGALQESLLHYQAAVDARPDFVEGRYQLGLALGRAGKIDHAINELQHVVASQPEAVKLRNNLGVMLFTAGRYQEAAAEFEKVLELEPDFAEARENLNRARQASVLPQKAE